MNAKEQKRFVKELVKSIQDEVIASISSGKISDDWDGIELRWYLAEKFENSTWSTKLNKKRYKEYNNAVLVNNL